MLRVPFLLLVLAAAATSTYIDYLCMRSLYSWFSRFLKTRIEREVRVLSAIAHRDKRSSAQSLRPNPQGKKDPGPGAQRLFIS